MNAARTFCLLALLVVAAPRSSPSRALIDNGYVFFAGYVVLQYIVLARPGTSWAATPAM